MDQVYVQRLIHAVIDESLREMNLPEIITEMMRDSLYRTFDSSLPAMMIHLSTEKDVREYLIRIIDSIFEQEDFFRQLRVLEWVLPRQYFGDRKMKSFLNSRKELAKRIRKISKRRILNRWGKIEIITLLPLLRIKNIHGTQALAANYIDTIVRHMPYLPWSSDVWKTMLGASYRNGEPYRSWDEEILKALFSEDKTLVIRQDELKLYMMLYISLSNDRAIDGYEFDTKLIPSRHGTAHLGERYYSEFNSLAMCWILVALLDWVTSQKVIPLCDSPNDAKMSDPKQWANYGHDSSRFRRLFMKNGPSRNFGFV